MKNETFDFHGSKFTIKVLTSETNGRFTILDVIHPPNLGPALHIHPKGSETFYIIKGDYEFILDSKSMMAKAGDVIFVPKGAPNWTGLLFKEYQEKKMASLPATTIICTIN